MTSERGPAFSSREPCGGPCVPGDRTLGQLCLEASPAPSGRRTAAKIGASPTIKMSKNFNQSPHIRGGVAMAGQFQELPANVASKCIALSEGVRHHS